MATDLISNFRAELIAQPDEDYDPLFWTGRIQAIAPQLLVVIQVVLGYDPSTIEKSALVAIFDNLLLLSSFSDFYTSYVPPPA